jgi:2-oxoglutarate dehydrogenase E2 component (dihydrolipoamide succinyltransferase)
MAQVELLMPKMGESIMEATILSWLKNEGDTIEQDESVLEVATDKVDTEVPSTHGGVLKQILAKEGDVVEVGKPIAIITTEAPAEKSSAPSTNGSDAARTDASQEEKKATSEEPVSNGQAQNGHISARNGDRFYSPLVRNIAKEEGIGVEELETIEGSGKEGRVTKKDILSYLEIRGQEPAQEQGRSQGPDQAPVQASAQASVQESGRAPVQGPGHAPVQAPVSVSGEDEIIEMDRMRKMIAQRMVDSKRIAPHVTSFVEADVTNLVMWRNRMKNEFKKREGDNLTFTPLFIDAVVKAIKDYPMINVQVDGDRIIKKKNINIGMAVALPSGNLIVPVIHNADQYNLTGLSKKVNDLARRARQNQLKPDELQGGTFTISNVGSFGNVMGTPIIMQPQVGILALGAIAKKPAVIETPAGDAIAIRHKMFLSHSYDHRVVDGSLGGMLVRRVADFLERFDMNSTI